MKLLISLGLVCLLAGCAVAPKTPPVLTLSGTEPGKVGCVYRVNTTAYIGKRNALSGPLCHGHPTSAASDWSRFPVGTRFKLVETGRHYIIDDYGSAMVGTHIIDLYMPTARDMHAWGRRNVHILIEEWGSSRRSLEILSPRSRAWYVRHMLGSLRSQSHGLPKEFHRIKE